MKNLLDSYFSQNINLSKQKYNNLKNDYYAREQVALISKNTKQGEVNTNGNYLCKKTVNKDNL